MEGNFRRCEQVVDGIDGEFGGINSTTACNFDSNLSIKDAIDELENLTRAVSLLDMFSTNESYEELPSAHLRFLLLPAYLGFLTENENNATDRLQLLKTAQAYYKDFLNRLQLYSVIPRCATDDADVEVKPSAMQSKPTMVSREEKIRRFNEQKELAAKVQTARRQYADDGDETALRELSTAQLRYWAKRVSEQLDSIDRELPMAERFAATVANPAATSGQQRSQSAVSKLKPIIITRDAVQKQVYGLGYPAFPSMTVDEWYDGMIAKRNQMAPPVSGSVVAHGDTTTDTATDDDEETMRLRRLDEYKDTHRRGWGNTQNKG